MSKKFIYIGADGLSVESPGAYETTDFVSSSAGAGDAGKPIVLDAGGNIDASMINDGDIDHGSIGGLSDDDHTQYTLASGTRDFSGIVQYASHPSFSADTDIIDKKYADDNIAAALQGHEWQDSVLDADVLDPSALTPTTSDRYLINGTGAGAWATHDNEIAEYNGSGWDFTNPTTGMFVSADDESSVVYYYGGSSWTIKSWEATTASTGLTKVGYDVQLDSSSAGGGLAFTTGVLSVNATNGVEVNADNVQLDLLSGGGLKLTGTEVGVEPNDFAGEGLADDGSDNLAIDWSTAFNDSKAIKASDLSSTATGKGASIIGVEDANGYFTGTDAEAVFNELYEYASQYKGVSYTAGTGGVSKGDLLYISANDTVLPYSTLSTSQRGVGIAYADASAAASVIVAANDTVVEGVLTGATAGTPYYWTGSALSTSIPTGSGHNVWQAGVAKNATDLHVEVRLVKRNA